MWFQSLRKLLLIKFKKSTSLVYMVLTFLFINLNRIIYKNFSSIHHLGFEIGA